MIKIGLKKDFKLLIMCIIVFCSCLIKYYIPSLQGLQYVFLSIHIITILCSKDDELIPMILFNHTCSSLYDDIGFKYIFNLSIAVATAKILIRKNVKINKNLFLLISILILYELCITFVNIGISLQIINLITFFLSYLFVVLIVSDDEKRYINIDKIFKYFFFGYIISGTSGYLYPLSKWGTKIPLAYRHKGLLRDSNYYSVDALLLMISSMLHNKKITKEALLVFIIGILAVSKMFILMSFLVFFVIAIYFALQMKNKKQMKKILIFLFMLPVALFFISKTNFVENMMNKYLYRTKNVSLLTGREYIQSYYANTIINDPITLVFGRSTSYANILKIGYDINDSFYYNIVAHNTYLDIILSWGILGLIIYIVFIRKLFSAYKINYNIKNRFNPVFIILISACLFVLSYLMLDFFAILILYVLMFSYGRSEEING